LLTTLPARRCWWNEYPDDPIVLFMNRPLNCLGGFFCPRPLKGRKGWYIAVGKHAKKNYLCSLFLKKGPVALPIAIGMDRKEKINVNWSGSSVG